MAGVSGFAPHVAAVGAWHVVARQVTGNRLVLGRGSAVGRGHRHVVHRAHRQRHRGRTLVAVGIGDGVGKAIRTVVVRVGRIGKGAAGVHHHRAVLRVGGFAPDVATIRAGRVIAGQRAGVGHVLVQRDTVIHRHRHLIGRRRGVAVDGDSHRRRAGVAVLVGDGVGEGIGQRLARLQGGDGQIAVVQRVAVAAIGVERDTAVTTSKGAAQRAARNSRDWTAHCRAIRADAVVGEGIAGYCSRALGDAVGVVAGRGHVVNDLDR